MRARRPGQTPRKPGVYYVRRSDGVELPVIDVTHPAFAIDVTEKEVRSRVDDFLRQPLPLGRMPAFFRNALLRVLLRRSMLASGIRRAEGAYLDAMSTYLAKLAPENLVAPYATPIDRRIAAALPAFTMRLRLQDIAHLVAGTLRTHLATSIGSPLRLVNIAGGTTIDTINALLVLRKEGLLVNRRIAIDVLDRDEEGPAFGQRILEALGEPGAPLHGVDVSLRHTPFDWNDPSTLTKVLGEGEAAAVGYSEGGLFEYGTDDAIAGNLRCLAAGTGVNFVMIGSVTRADEPMQRLWEMPHVAVKPRGLDAFRALIAGTGWHVTRVIERPFSDHVVLARTA